MTRHSGTFFLNFVFFIEKYWICWYDIFAIAGSPACTGRSNGRT